jgi:hypothetical protein
VISSLSQRHVEPRRLVSVQAESDRPHRDVGSLFNLLFVFNHVLPDLGLLVTRILVKNLGEIIFKVLLLLLFIRSKESRASTNSPSFFVNQATHLFATLYLKIDVANELVSSFVVVLVRVDNCLVDKLSNLCF